MTGLPTRLPDLGAVDACCFASAFVRRTARDNTPWRFNRAPVTGLGIDLKDFPIAADDPPPWTGRLLFAGRVEVRKGVETLVRAVPRLDPDTTLDLVGPVEDGYRSHLETLADELGLRDRVRFASAPRTELRDHYRAADVVIVPSEWEEPFGLVPLEAMACGRPVIASGTGGSAEFLRDGVNCLLFPAGDVVALAAAIQRLTGDASLRSRLVEGGVQTASVLDTDRMATILEEWHLAAADRFAHGEPQARPLAP